MTATVDWAPWKALTRALLKRDFRTRTMSVGRAGSRQQMGAGTFLSQAILYGVFGLLISVMVAASQDLFFIGIVMCTYVMFMVGTAVLLDHSSALTAADDYNVLGFRPVSSRTYFAVRLTNVMVYTLTITTMVAVLPVIALTGGVVAALAQPLGHALSRWHEVRADRYALEATRNPDAFVSSVRRLGAQNLADERPPRLVHWLFATHPSVPERIAEARAWASGRGGM